MAISINDQKAKYSPEDIEFIEGMKNRLTLYGQIPYNIPDELIVAVIKQSAKWFYIHASACHRQTYFHINKSEINPNNEFSGFTSCVVQLSPRIRNVKEVYDSTESSNPDLSSAMYLSASVGGAQGLYQTNIDNNLYILESATKMVEARALKNIFGSHIPFEYVCNSSELVLKKIPNNNILLDCTTDLELKFVYNYVQFYDHVLSKCRGELKRLLGGHTFELPGGVVMNADEICSGFDDWKDIEIYVKSSNSLGDIILKR